MKKEIVLPKFTVPGQRPNWVVRALWGAGGLVVVQMAVLGLVLVKKQRAHVAAAGVPATALVQASAAAPVAPLAAGLGAPVPGAQTTLASVAAPTGRFAPSAGTPSTKTPRSGRRAKVAKASLAHGGTGKAHVAMAKRGGKADALDALLRRLK